ncbi:MAG: hypothetical protein NC820_05010, partial [Candidatus Omnitrophica bacterium]|nr:hypothetical protein [Candidatus Omnitrophota bacterium]
MLFIFALIFFLGRPLSKYSKSVKKELETKQEELKRAESLVRTIPNPPQEIEKIRKALDELNDKAVSQQELPRLIQQ